MHAYFNLGTRNGEDPGVTAANRAALRRSLELPSEPAWLHQVHGPTVRAINSGDRVPRQTPPEADAAYTREPGVVLAVQTADCLPILLGATDGGEVAAIHAGWRGLCAGVIEATLAQLATPASRLQAWLGPAIGWRCYEVGAEVRAEFLTRDPGDAAGFQPARAGHWYLDLVAIAQRRLSARGVGCVAVDGSCTHADARRFYSHRRDGVTGRMASLIWIAPDEGSWRGAPTTWHLIRR